jgi:DNA (cytosine-5)-methyltransferase 1
LADAGFEVHGIDIEDQPEYPYPTRFTRGSALAVDVEYLQTFDLIWASPPCQKFTAYKRRPGHVLPRLNFIPATRELLKKAGAPYIIENVTGARAELSPDAVTLCGSMFGLDVRRHRLFECSWPIHKSERPKCRHALQKPGRFPGATNRAPNSRATVEVGVWRIPLDVQRKAMGIDWMSLEKLSQAIPPAYSEWLGKSALAYIQRTSTEQQVAGRVT